MSPAPDLESLQPSAVDAVLGITSAAGIVLAPADRDAFTISVLLNALSRELEEVRERDPEEHALYQAIAMSMLGSGPDVSGHIASRIT